jgi:hypothetical protein
MYAMLPKSSLHWLQWEQQAVTPINCGSFADRSSPVVAIAFLTPPCAENNSLELLWLPLNPSDLVCRSFAHIAHSGEKYFAM